MDIAFEPPIRQLLPSFRTEPNAERGTSMRERTEALHGLPRGRTLTIARPQGQEVTCQRGRLCLRHEGDGEGSEHLLSAGQTYLCERDIGLRVHALDDSLIWSSSLGGLAAAVTRARRS